MYLGYYGFEENGYTHINTDDMKTFYDETGRVYEDDGIGSIYSILKSYAITLNSPWSQSHMRYITELNCKDAYTAMDPKAPVYRTYYIIVGCESIEAAIFGYGNTQEKSLKNCMEHLDIIQKKFNPEEESF